MSLIVVIHHILLILRDTVPAYNAAIFTFISDGKLAVQVFFVLSGFALSTGYLRSRDCRALAKLAIRRYPRLTLPILASSLLTFIALKSGLVYSTEAASLLSNDWWLGSFYHFNPTVTHLLSFSLFDVYFRYDPTTSYNPFLWTMPIEFSGSLLVFATLFIAHYIPYRFTLYLPIFATLYILKDPMLPFLFGIMLAELHHMRCFATFRQTPYGLTAGLAATALGIYASTYCRPLLEAPRSAAFIALAIASGPFLSRHIARLFETSLSRFLGRISFPLYLVHCLVISSLFSYLSITIKTHADLNFATCNCLALITLEASLLAAICFAPVEEFSIYVSHVFSRRVMGRRVATH